MRIYNANTDKIEKRTTLRDEIGIHILGKLTDEQLNALGCYKLKINSKPNNRYYTSTKSGAIVGTEYVITYVSVDKELDDVKSSLITDLQLASDKYESEAIITTEQGFKVKAARNNLDDFERGAKRNKNKARDIYGVEHTVTKSEMTKIASDIETNGEALYDTFWEIFDEIQALTTVQECVDYEHSPYDYVVTQEDVDNDRTGELTLGETIVKYKNNVTDWS